MANAAISHDQEHASPGFFARWFMSTNHKNIGTLYLIFAVFAGLIGGTLSGYQLMTPGSHLVGDDHQLYNVIVAAHGLTMIFFTMMPALIAGFGNWFTPSIPCSPASAAPPIHGARGRRPWNGTCPRPPYHTYNELAVVT